jgi:hypothetical protein
MTECPSCRRLTVGYEHRAFVGVVGRCGACGYEADLVARHTCIEPARVAHELSEKPQAIRNRRYRCRGCGRPHSTCAHKPCRMRAAMRARRAA